MSDLYDNFRFCLSPLEIIEAYLPYYKESLDERFITNPDEELIGSVLFEAWPTTKDPALYNKFPLPYNPLLEPLILSNVLEHLGSKELKTSRLVCQQWNAEVRHRTTVDGKFEVHLKEPWDSWNTTLFFNLIHDPYFQLPIGHLEIINPLGIYSDKWHQLFKSIGTSIKTLVLSLPENREWAWWESYFLSDLANLCPQLETLALTFGNSNQLELDNDSLSREQYSNGIFANLKHLLIDINFCDYFNPQAVGELLAFFLDSAASSGLVSLTIQDVSKKETIDVISFVLEERPHIIQNLKYLDMDKYSPILSHWRGTELRLKTLNITKLDISFSPEHFAKILEATSATLTSLNLDTDHVDSHEELADFQLYFPCEMKRLEIITAFSKLRRIHGGSMSMLQRLPRLKTLIDCHRLKDEPWMSYNPMLWQRIFRDKDGNLCEIINKNLLILSVDAYVIDIQIFQNIQRAFPELRHLHLSLDGTLLPEVIDGLRDFRLQTFSIKYYETPRGMSDFDSALTGIPVEDCETMLNERSYQNEKISRRSSLADLKYLRILTIQYKTQDAARAILDPIAVSGLFLATSVTELTLVNFQIDSKLLGKILKKIPETILLRSRVISQKRKEMDFIQNRFPTLELEDSIWLVSEVNDL